MTIELAILFAVQSWFGYKVGAGKAHWATLAVMPALILLHKGF